MTRLRTGYKPGVGPVLKLMINDADDPFTTPNTAYGKFGFNSEVDQISYLLEVKEVKMGGATTFPPGAGSNVPNVYAVAPHYKVEAFLWAGTHTETHILDFRTKYGLPYDPFVELRGVNLSIGTVPITVHDYSWDQLWGTLTFNGASGDAVGAEMAGTLDFWTGKVHPGCAVASFRGNAGTSQPTYYMSVWEFPGKSDDYVLPSAAPVSGQKVLSIRPSGAKMARRGFDVDTAVGRQFIFNSDRIPAKIIACGDILLPGSGQVDVMLPVPFNSPSPLLYVDGISKYTATPYFSLPTLRATNVSNWWEEGPTFDYRVMEDRVRFLSTNTQNIDIRYMLVAHDGQSTSGGTAKVMRGGDELGYIQIVRPGAQNPPKLGDIILDSRLPYIPILSQGFIPASSFSLASDNTGYGTHMATPIAIPDTGDYLPFLKFSAVMGELGNRPEMPARPLIHRPRNQPNIGWNGRPTSGSTMAKIESSAVTFYASPGAPGDQYWNPEGPTAVTAPPAPFQGIRYYIMALPKT